MNFLNDLFLKSMSFNLNAVFSRVLFEKTVEKNPREIKFETIAE